MIPPIRFNKQSFENVRTHVAGAAEQVGQLRDLLKSSYYGNRPAMGDSKDLRVTDGRYEAMLNDVRTLKVALDDYADILLRIQRLYRKAQENAILRASQIPH